MSEPFLSEIKIMSFNFPPKGWALCNGQLMPINQNQALFALLGTTYGGDGRQTFGLPNLQGRAPMHAGSGHVLGELGGEQMHTLSIGEMPTHDHGVTATSATATSNAPSPSVMLAQSRDAFLYGANTNMQAMDPAAVTYTGQSQPHANMQPYLTLSFCIALQGIFPSQN